jgi:hypothetical protein
VTLITDRAEIAEGGRDDAQAVAERLASQEAADE